MIYIRKRVVGHIVTVNGQPTGLALAKNGADIVSEERSSLKGTRLFFDTSATVFPSRRAAKRAIERTASVVASLQSSWTDADYEIVPVVVLHPVAFRRAN